MMAPMMAALATFGIARDSGHAVQEPQHNPVVGGAEASGQQAEDHEERQPRQSRGVDRCDVEVRVVSEDEPRAGDSGDGGEDGGQHCLHPKRSGHLFEGEQGAADGRVEGHRQSGTAQRGLHHAYLGRGQPRPSRCLSPDRGPHVHGRALAAQDQTRADRQHAADEFGRKQPDLRCLRITPIDRFDVLDAAAGSQGLPPHDQGGQRRTDRRSGDRDQPSGSGQVVGPLHEIGAGVVGGLQAPAESAADEADNDPGERRRHTDEDRSAHRCVDLGWVLR